MVTGTEIAASVAGKQIAEAFGKAFDSPSKEIGNYIADKIRYLRYQSLLDIVSKAEEKAKNKGLHLKMPPIKFFVPFCETASLEDNSGPHNINDLWANLLVSACARDDIELLVFIRVLGQIGPNEAELIVDIVERGRANTFAMMVSIFNTVDARYFDERGIVSLVSSLPDDFPIEYVADLIVDTGECTGVLFEEVAVIEEDFEYSIFDHDKTVNREISANILVGLGLFERLDISIPGVQGRFSDVEISLSGYRITPLGVRFYERCSDTKFKKSFDYFMDHNDYLQGFADWLARRTVA